MNSAGAFRTACKGLAVTTFLVGVLGMAASLLLMLVVGGVELFAAAAGLVSGSVLAAGGLIATSILVAAPGRRDAKGSAPADFE
jgi:hypothetical protein